MIQITEEQFIKESYNLCVAFSLLTGFQNNELAGS